MKELLLLIGLILPLLSYGQAKKDTLQVLAKLVSPGQGNKIYIAEYEVIKVIKGTLPHNRIKVGYYSYKRPKEELETALLHLTTYTGNTAMDNYYIFPNYNAINGIEPVQFSYVDLDDWVACETGEGDCKPFTFTRPTKDQKWYLIMPCGGTQTDVILAPWEENPIQHESVGYSNCPPVFELSKLPDGKYRAHMLACNLGGTVEINLKTEKE